VGHVVWSSDERCWHCDVSRREYIPLLCHRFTATNRTFSIIDLVAKSCCNPPSHLKVAAFYLIVAFVLYTSELVRLQRWASHNVARVDFSCPYVLCASRTTPGLTLRRAQSIPGGLNISRLDSPKTAGLRLSKCHTPSRIN
jgi:hypothetical protein